MVCVLRFPLSVALVAWFLFASVCNGQWQKVGPKDFISPDRKKGCAVSFADGVVWAGAHSLWLSSDLGLTWRQSPTFPLAAPSDTICGIYFFDRMNGFVLANSRTFMTTDGGSTWNLLPIASSRWGAYASTADTFYLRSYGYVDEIVKGVSVNQVYGTQWISPVVFGHGHAHYLDGGQLYTSQDGGATWNAGSFADIDCNAIAIDSCDANTIYLVNEEIFIPSMDNFPECMFISHDDGNTWVSRNLQDSGYYAGDLATSKYAVYTQTRDGILRSTDKGETWMSIGGPTGPPDNLSLAVVSDTIIVAIDSFGNLWRTQNDGGNPFPQTSAASVTIRDVHIKDTIGEAVWLPIVIKHGLALDAIMFQMTYDTSSLIFEHFTTSNGTPITLEDQTLNGVPMMLYHVHAGSSFDTIYALFSWYPTTQSSTEIRIDSIVAIISPASSCSVTINPFTNATASGRIYCETSILSHFMRYNEPPYLSIQPNPALRTVSIQSNVADAQLIVNDALGRIVTRFESVPKEINVSDLPSGLYYLHVSGGREHVTRPLIVSH